MGILLFGMRETVIVSCLLYYTVTLALIFSGSVELQCVFQNPITVTLHRNGENKSSVCDLNGSLVVLS